LEKANRLLHVDGLDKVLPRYHEQYKVEEKMPGHETVPRKGQFF